MILVSQHQPLQLQPFRYSIIQEALEPHISCELLTWLETDAPWSHRIADFYEQYEFSFMDVRPPAGVQHLFSSQSLTSLRNQVAELFGTPLAERMDITAHKLAGGQRIRIHNDYIPGQESHRLLIQLNRGWTDANGGALIFFNSDNPSDIHRILRPAHNSGVLFEISPHSLHAVTPVTNGERFTLVVSFFRAT